MILQEWGLRDLYFFSKYILGYFWLTEPVHTDFALKVQEDIPGSLFLLPRGHCKTTIFTFADTIRQYLISPSEPIFIVSDTLKRSTAKVSAIKWIFEHSERLKNIYSDRLWENPQKVSPLWTREALVLPGHTGRQEPSIMATSLENQPTGFHAPRIKFDDLVTPEGVTTSDQIKKTKDLYGIMRSSIIQPPGNVQIAGTIYDDGDLHRDMERSGLYRVYKKSACFEPGTGKPLLPTNPSAMALWPEQYGLEKQEEIRRDPTVGDYIYSCQYLLDPAPESGDSFFRMQWFPRYKPEDLAGVRLRMYSAADLAISEKESAAYSAFVTAGVDHENRIWIINVRRGHWNAFDIIEELIHLQRRYEPEIFPIECENIERTIKPFLVKRMMETGVYLNLEEITPYGDKVARARSIQGRARQGAVMLPAQGADAPSWLAEFEHELRRFPRAATKDQVDALSLIGLILNKQLRPETDAEINYRAESGRYVPLDPLGGI